MVWIDLICVCYKQSSWFGSMTWLCDCNSTLPCTLLLENRVNYTFLLSFGSVHHLHHGNSFKEKLIRASNRLNWIVGPTSSFLNRQFVQLSPKLLNYIIHSTPFSLNMSDVQCTISNRNYSIAFSLSKAFQRYIICNFPLPIRYFSIFELFSVENSGKQKRGARMGEEMVILSRWAPSAVEEMREEQRRAVVHFGWTRCTQSGPTCKV
jgi:hypothetical protein